MLVNVIKLISTGLISYICLRMMLLMILTTAVTTTTTTKAAAAKLFHKSYSNGLY